MGLIAQRLGRKASHQVGYPATGWRPPMGISGVTATGVTITQDRANGIAAWYAGVSRISKDVAKLPLITYRRDGRNKERATDHPMYRLLKTEPNPEMTSIVWRESAMGHLINWGNAFAERELNGNGETVRLWPLLPDRMRVEREEGQRVYYYRIRPEVAEVRLTADRVFHIPGYGFDGLMGYPLMTLARETLGQTIALREYQSRVLANDARPGVILSHPGTLSDPARKNIEESWADNHGGFSNAGRSALLEEGMTVTALGLPRQDMLFVEAQKWGVAEAARWLELAPHKIGDLSHATFSNVTESNLDHLSSTLMPYLVKWEQQIDKDLLPEPDMFAEHLLDAVLRGNALERYQGFAIMAANKALTPNEWRAFENMNPVDWGDEPIETPNNSAGDFVNETPKSDTNILVDAASPVIVNSAPEVHVDSVVVGEKAAETMATAATEGIAEGIGTVAGTLSENNAITVASFAAAAVTIRELKADLTEAKAREEELLLPVDKSIEYDEKGAPSIIVEQQGTRITRKRVTHDAEGRIAGMTQIVARV